MQIIVLALILVMFYVKSCMVKNQDTKVLNFKRNKFILIISSLGIITFILPWINLPIIGGVSPLKMLSNSNFATRVSESVIDVIIPLSVLYIGMIIGSIIQIKLKSQNKITKIFEIISASICIIYGISTIIDFNSFWSAPNDGGFGDALSMTFSVGFGLYLLVLLGLSQIVGLILIKD